MIFMKKRKDGRYQSSITITDPLTNEKKRIYVYGYTESEVIRELNRVKLNNGKELLMPTFKEWKNEWLNIKSEEVSNSTISSYKDSLRLHISPILDKYKLKDITPSLIRTVLRNIPTQRTKEYCYIIINAILNQALREDLIDKNPCINVKKPKSKPKEASIITNEEFNMLLNSAKNTQFEIILRLAFDTGMRRSEICALRWEDIDFNKNIIHVRHAIKIDRYAPIETRFSIGEPKTDYGIRDIALTGILKLNLQKHQIRQKEFFKNKNRILSLKDFVFMSQHHSRLGNFIQPDNITHEFVKLKRKAGIKSDITFKSFRHTCLTSLAEANIPAKAIQAHAGHANASFTLNRYVHKTEQMTKSIAEYLNERNKKLTSQ